LFQQPVRNFYADSDILQLCAVFIFNVKGKSELVITGNLTRALMLVISAFLTEPPEPLTGT
jgi:hypothetical protein